MLFRQTTYLILTCFCVLSPAFVAAADLNLVPWPRAVQSPDGPPWQPGTPMRARVPELIPGAKEHFCVVTDALRMLADSDIQFVNKAREADLVVVVEPALAADAFTLKVQAGGVQIEASALQGIAHATATLLQLIGQHQGKAIPALEIQDEPDYG